MADVSVVDDARDDQWDWWHKALLGQFGPLDANTLQSGFFRARGKKKGDGFQELTPVAYWREDGVYYCRIGNTMATEQRALELWPYIRKEPVTYDAYLHALKTGMWPDQHPAAEGDRRNSVAMADPDSPQGLGDRVADLGREAAELIRRGPARTKLEADQAADLARRLGVLESRATELRKAAVEPLRRQIKDFDGVWNPIISKASEGKTNLKRDVVAPFLREMDRKARADAAEAAKKGAEPAPAPRTVAGATSKVALREVRSARVVDYEKALAYFAEHAEVKALIQKLANSYVRSAAAVLADGCELVTDQVAA